MRQAWRRAGAVLVGAVVGVLVAGPAWAHVTVSSSSAAPGSFAKLTFRVPNEKDNATTTRLEIHFPTATPLAFVSVKPVPGWTAQVTRGKLATPIKVHDSEITEAVSTIVWTAAEGASVKPGEFQEFDVSAGPLPEADQLVFKALQGYSDGDVVRWIEEPKDGQAEPEHPAPVLKLAKAGAPGNGAQVSATTDEAAGSGSTGTATAALVIAVLGLLAGGGALALTLLGRRPTST